MKLSNMFKRLSKRLAAGAIVALAIALPVATFAAETVKIEADTTVANATAGETTWNGSTNASYNQVVAVQVVYNNKEEAGSGKIATNQRVKINVPTTAGTNQVITTKTGADNSNTVNGSATVTLNRADAYLQYIPGTATWKHASVDNGPMTVTQKVSDDVVMAADGLVLENENPCQAGSIVIQARVMVPGVKVTKEVRNLVAGATWSTSNTAKPGEEIQYRITYQNTGNTDQTAVIIRDNLPAGTTLVPQSTHLTNAANPNGILSQSDTIAQGGIRVGDYKPTANAYVSFRVKMPTEDQLKCGVNTLTNVGVAQPNGMQEYYNTTTTTITKQCETKTPVYSCDAFHVTPGDKTVTVDTFSKTATSGATFKFVSVNWGDNTVATDSDNIVGKSHVYAAAGTYTITATAHFAVAGNDDAKTTNNCTQTVSFTTPTTPTPPVTPPTKLPDTGAGNVIGLFAAAVVAGTFGYRLFLSRKLAR